MKKKSIHTLLLRALLLLSIMTLTVTSVIFSIMQYRTLKNNATNDMQRNCRSIALSLGQKVHEMDTILLYSIASSELKDSFKRYLESDTSFEKFRARQELGGIMISLKGFDFSNRQLNIYDTKEGGYGVGNYNGELKGSVTEKHWYEKSWAAAGKKYIYAPAQDILVSRSAGLDDKTLYFSLIRLFYGAYHTPLGFMEVKAYYDEIFEPLRNDILALQPVIVIYDSDGRQIYPEHAEYPYFNYRDENGKEIINSYTGKRQYLCFSESKENGLTVAMAVDDEVFMDPVYRSFIPIILIVILILIICIILSTMLSRQMSDPIRQIYAFLSDTGKGQFTKLELSDSGVLEIDKLRDSINESIDNQETSTKTLLTLKEQEVQSQMLALQSQMNPHFLYNSLSMIGEMADSGMTEEVSKMCEDITSILRYISSNREQRIRVEEEMEQVDRYLFCIKRRFGEGLKYSYDIPDEILDCMAPKLCVQLLVENSVKAVMTHREPWEIKVEGLVKGEDWEITVYDNGPGFDPVVDKELRHNMDEILANGVLPSLRIEGMGILNIFIRLYLLDGIPFVFDFGNREEGGAYVKIGGHIRDKA